MKRIIIFPILLLSTVTLVYADAGTPLIWAGTLHLFIGNAIIGVVEGLILAYFFHLKKVKCIWLMIFANYFSAWIGGVFITGYLLNLVHKNLYNLRIILWGAIFITYILTLILEYPFVAYCFRRNPQWFRKSIQGNLLAQTASYILLFGWYGMASDMSLYSTMKIVEPSELSLPKNVQIYYISEKDGDVYTRMLSDSKEKKIFDLRSKNPNDRLYVRPAKSGKGEWDLIARLETQDYKKPNLVTIETSFTTLVAINSEDTEILTPDFAGDEDYLRRANQFESINTSGWRFRSNNWATDGFKAWNIVNNKAFKFGLDTPFAEWYVRNLTQLPNDEVLFQLGENQICLVEPNSRKIALIAYGWGPVATLISDHSNDK